MSVHQTEPGGWWSRTEDESWFMTKCVGGAAVERELGEALGVVDVVGDGEGHDAVEVRVNEAKGGWGEHVEPLGDGGSGAVRREGRGTRGVDRGGGSGGSRGGSGGSRGGSGREEGWGGGSRDVVVDGEAGGGGGDDVAHVGARRGRGGCVEGGEAVKGWGVVGEGNVEETGAAGG